MNREFIKVWMDYERYRQDQKHPDFPKSHVDRLCILIEEIGEIGTALQNKDMNNLQEELIQVMAVCCRWLENMSLKERLK